MPGRWSAESVLALAPDDASARAATGLARSGPWSGTGAAGDLVWGLCAGSGKNPYQAIVDLSGPAYRCSCPSRKFPCKHALGLLLLWAGGAVPDEPAPADYAQAWLESRREKASRSLVRTGPAASPASAGSEARENGNGAAAGQTATVGAGDANTGQDGAETGAGKDAGAAAGAARRAQERALRVAGGLTELQEWLRDQVRFGLAATVSSRARTSPDGSAAGFSDAIAARMVDAQAPGVAGVLRSLSMVPASGEGWPARLLSEYARLHLLARAHERLGTLPPGLAAVVRSRVGYTTSRQEVLTLPAVTDHWLVLGVRDLVDGQVPGRRIWLRGRDTGRYAMLLTFAGNGYWQDPDTARLRPGTELHADLHYYPGQPPLRALTGERHASPTRKPCPAPDGDIDTLLAGWAAGLADDPWLTTWPALLTGTPVPPGQAAQGRGPAAETPGRAPEVPGRASEAPEASGAPDPLAAREPWYLVDRTGAALPLAEFESTWTLLAISGGHPVTIAAEWHGERLLPLTVWHQDEAVPL